MSVVILGGNRFIDCLSILAYQGRPLLQVSLNPLRVELATPGDLPSGRVVKVDQTAKSVEKDVRVAQTSQSFAIFWQDYPIVLVGLIDSETALVKLDLRPVGINIYDDFAGLHIGTNVFARNEVRNAAAAINLGD